VNAKGFYVLLNTEGDKTFPNSPLETLLCLASYMYRLICFNLGQANHCTWKVS